jgi:predicted protein tyrosine phosphatase
MKKVFYWVASSYLFVAPLSSLQAAPRPLSAEETVRILQHQKAETLIISFQSGGERKILDALSKGPSMAGLIIKRMKNEMQGHHVLDLQDMEKLSSKTHLLLFFTNTQLTTQQENVSAVYDYLVKITPKAIAIANLEDTIIYADANGASELFPPVEKQPLPQRPNLFIPGKGNTAGTATASPTTPLPADLPLSRLQLPTTAEFSFGLPAGFVLYIGTVQGYWNEKNMLAEHHITHTLSLVDVNDEKSYPKPKPFTPYEVPTAHQLHILNFADTTSANLREKIPTLLQFFDQALTDNQTVPSHVFVHCHAGVSRSPSAVMVFLLHSRAEYLKMHHQKWEAYTPTELAYLRTINPEFQPSMRLSDVLSMLLRHSRPVVSPNIGFAAQLAEYENKLKTEVNQHS